MYGTSINDDSYPFLSVFQLENEKGRAPGRALWAGRAHYSWSRSSGDLITWHKYLGDSSGFTCISYEKSYFLTPCPELIKVYKISICLVLRCPYILTPISSRNPDRRSNFFFNPPAHLCAVTYITEISFLVTLSNKSHSHTHSCNFW